MASPFLSLLTSLVTFVFLCSAQSVCRPPSDEKCVCNCGDAVVNIGNDNAFRAELEELKITVKQLSQTGKSVGIPANDTNTDKPQDCQDILDNDETTPSGVYMVYPRDNLGGFLVYCDMDTDGGGWTLFQRRQDGTVDFYRGWADYKTGFPSNLNGEFWLGNDNLYRLAVQKVYQLRVDLEDVEGETRYAVYDTLKQHRGESSSTKDRDTSTGCAQRFKGAWWYRTSSGNSCHHSNLNGLYHLGTHESHADGVCWYDWKGNNYSLKRSEMKLRPTP
ncbi:Fibrinogen C domain-containing protein 1 [Branchiostoma belcheri]|nr:Fibrinogen C domain-containing protein 1 [Branchiostoma belcheri]